MDAFRLSDRAMADTFLAIVGGDWVADPPDENLGGTVVVHRGPAHPSNPLWEPQA